MQRYSRKTACIDYGSAEFLNGTSCSGPIELAFSPLQPTISTVMANKFLAPQARHRINQSPDSHSGLATNWVRQFLQ
jgi:hypothetical protein